MDQYILLLTEFPMYVEVYLVLLWFYDMISPTFLVWEFCRNAHFPQSFGRISKNSAENVRFDKIPTPEN